MASRLVPFLRDEELSNCFALKRRTGKRPVIQAPAAPLVKSKEKLSTKPQETQISTQELNSSNRPSSSGNPSTSISQTGTKSTDKKSTSKPKPLKQERSDIFKSFSKPKAKINREDTGSSAGASPAPTNVPSVRTRVLTIETTFAKPGSRTQIAIKQMVRKTNGVRDFFY